MTVMKKIGTDWMGAGACYALGLLMVIGLKRHYSHAMSEDLQWILAPTAATVEAITGIRFERELHTGFINRDYGVIVAPVCAGVNFLIIAFSAFWFPIVGRLQGATRRFAWIGMSAVMAYLLTIMTNALRIVTSMHFYRADIYGAWLTPERLHRIQGIVIYFSVLVLIYPLTERIATRFNQRKFDEFIGQARWESGLATFAWALAVPFLSYTLGTIAMPLLNGAWGRHGLKFLEHCVLVLACCTMIVLVILMIVLGFQKLVLARGKLKGKCTDHGG